LRMFVEGTMHRHVASISWDTIRHAGTPVLFMYAYNITTWHWLLWTMMLYCHLYTNTYWL